MLCCKIVICFEIVEIRFVGYSCCCFNQAFATADLYLLMSYSNKGKIFIHSYNLCSCELYIATAQ